MKTPLPLVAMLLISARAIAGPTFHPYRVVDHEQGGLVVGTIAVPDGWTATSSVHWNYSDVSLPVRLSLRIAAPDGSAWVEAFPTELFYWLEPHDTSTPVGGRSLGMIHRPGIAADEALHRFVIQRYRGGAEDLRLLGTRSTVNLAQALGKPAMPGDSVAARVRYRASGHTVDEEFFALLGSQNRIPYHGPQGTSFEDHRLMTYAHSMGALDGKLDSLQPMLGFIVASFRPDPVWQRHLEMRNRQIAEAFNRYIAAGYAQIAAAAQLSRTVSANNDALLRSMEAQRRASNRAADRINEQFSDYIRGTDRRRESYWGRHPAR